MWRIILMGYQHDVWDSKFISFFSITIFSGSLLTNRCWGILAPHLLSTLCRISLSIIWSPVMNCGRVFSKGSDFARLHVASPVTFLPQDVNHVLWDCNLVRVSRESNRRTPENKGWNVPAGGWWNSDWFVCEVSYRACRGSRSLLPPSGGFRGRVTHIGVLVRSHFGLSVFRNKKQVQPSIWRPGLSNLSRHFGMPETSDWNKH